MIPVDTTTWPVVAPSTIGKRTAQWVSDPEGTWWLRKFPRRRVGTEQGAEPLAETIAARIAREAGLPAPIVKLCTLNGELGIVSRKFHGHDQVLTHGSELVQRLQPEYDPNDHALHTVELALKALDDISGGSLRSEFIRMLAFDAWIGNGDRHQENWGVINAERTSPRLAPAYDMAACLGSGLADASVRKTLDDRAKLERFVDRCPSGFGNGTKLVSMRDVVAQLRTLDEWRAGSSGWLTDFRGAERFARGYIEGIPIELFSDGRKRFATEMLSRRLQWLERHVP